MITTAEQRRAPAADPGPAVRPSRRRPALIVGVLVVAALIAAWLIAFSSVFGVRTIVVQGTQVLTPGEVRAAAAVGIGTPLVRLDTAAVLARVRAMSDIASAQVRTSFPSTVVITVVERRPVGYVKAGAQNMLVDRSGVQYRAVAAPPVRLPLFQLPVGPAAAASGAAVATVAAALPVDVRARITSIVALDPNAITLVVRHGRIVVWGSADSSAAKARILPALLRRGADQINVSNPNLPYTR